MKNVAKYVPWFLIVVIAIAFVFVWTSMNQEISQKNSELMALQGKYDQFVAETNTKLTNLSQEKLKMLEEKNEEKLKIVEEANQEKSMLIAEANEKINAANKPEGQVQVGFRKALLHSGGVAVLKNIAQNSVAVTIEILRPSSRSNKTFEVTLDSNQVKEIGAREGWAFVAGDIVRVNQANHKLIEVTSP